MKVKIRTKNFWLFIPAPLRLAGFVVRLLPDQMFEQMRANTPEPYCGLITKENVRMIVKESLTAVKGYRGLEIIHVEAQDGTRVSVKL